jgi:hypothetical protein
MNRHKKNKFSDETRFRAPSEPVSFLYADVGDKNLKNLRARHHLDEIAGKGPEREQIVRLMTWVHRLASQEELPIKAGLRPPALDKEKKKNADRYLKSVFLNGVYLAMGFASRHTHLLPLRDEYQGCHYVTSVFSRDLQRWLMMDPDFGVYVTDEQGVILGVAQIRRRLMGSQALKVVRPGKSWLKKMMLRVTEYLEGVDYLWFLSDLIYKIRCPKLSGFAQDCQAARTYFELLPNGYRENPLIRADLSQHGKQVFYLDDEALFWQEPRREALSA